MAIGIWTPVANSNLRVVNDLYGGNINNFASKVKAVAPVAGTHLMIINQTNEPVYYHTVQPTTDAEGLTGNPVPPYCEGNLFVIPRTGNFWLYCGESTGLIQINVGTMS